MTSDGRKHPLLKLIFVHILAWETCVLLDSWKLILIQLIHLFPKWAFEQACWTNKVLQLHNFLLPDQTVQGPTVLQSVVHLESSIVLIIWLFINWYLTLSMEMQNWTIWTKKTAKSWTVKWNLKVWPLNKWKLLMSNF